MRFKLIDRVIEFKKFWILFKPGYFQKYIIDYYVYTNKLKEGGRVYPFSCV